MEGAARLFGNVEGQGGWQDALSRAGPVELIEALQCKDALGFTAELYELVGDGVFLGITQIE